MNVFTPSRIVRHRQRPLSGALSMAFSAGLLAASMTCNAAPVARLVAGGSPAEIQATVDQFRADLGGANNGAGGTFAGGRREINWDGVPDTFAEPNNLPANFFNANSPRGIVFNSIEDATGDSTNQFSVSAKLASGTAVRFGNINAAYSSSLQTFSAERLFIARNTHLMEASFFLPGTSIPATVSGFGIVFCDVDTATGGGKTVIRYYSISNALLGTATAQPWDNGLSFVGVSFDAGERIARVVIESGNAGLSATNNDGQYGVDIVAMDDFIYGEPRSYDTLFVGAFN